MLYLCISGLTILGNTVNYPIAEKTASLQVYRRRKKSSECLYQTWSLCIIAQFKVKCYHTQNYWIICERQGHQGYQKQSFALSECLQETFVAVADTGCLKLFPLYLPRAVLFERLNSECEIMVLVEVYSTFSFYSGMGATFCLHKDISCIFQMFARLTNGRCTL